MNSELVKLIKYVNTAADLAEALERDIKNGKTISNDTVLKLSKHVSATQHVVSLLAGIEADSNQLQ